MTIKIEMTPDKAKTLIGLTRTQRELQKLTQEVLPQVWQEREYALAKFLIERKSTRVAGVFGDEPIAGILGIVNWRFEGRTGKVGAGPGPDHVAMIYIYDEDTKRMRVVASTEVKFYGFDLQEAEIDV